MSGIADEIMPPVTHITSRKAVRLPAIHDSTASSDSSFKISVENSTETNHQQKYDHNIDDRTYIIIP